MTGRVKNTVFAVMTVLAVVAGSSMASADKTRVYFKDGSYVDVVTDDRGTYTRDGAGNHGSQSGDSSREGHDRAVRDQEKSYDHDRTVREPK